MKRILRKQSALSIQCFTRQYLARKRLREKVLAEIEVVDDEETEFAFFYHVKTEASSWEIPSILTKRLKLEKSDILTPRSRKNLVLKIERREAGRMKKCIMDENKAVTLLQGLYRVAKCKRILREKAKKAIVKVYDADQDAFFYYNKLEKTSSWSKPHCLVR